MAAGDDNGLVAELGGARNRAGLLVMAGCFFAQSNLGLFSVPADRRL